MRKGVVAADGTIVNVIEIGEGGDWMPPANHALTDLACEKGDHLVDGAIQKKPAPVRPLRAIDARDVSLEMWRRIQIMLGASNRTEADDIVRFEGASASVAALYAKARALIESRPVPADYRDDKYWT